MQLEALAVELPHVSGHPNRAPFRGVLTFLDVPSDRAPSGARGRRVVLTRAAAERALASLIGMGLDYTPELDGHDARRKVGIITSAEVEGTKIVVAGYLFAHDFPEVVEEIARGGGKLGMSYEIAGAEVQNTQASIWRIVNAVFTGAAVLLRSKAAYENTSIELMEAA